MAWMVAAVVLAAVFAAASAVSIAIADLPYCPDDHRKARRVRLAVYAAALLCNAVILLLLHWMFRGSADLGRTLALTVGARLSYQAMAYLYGILLLWIPLAAASGFGIRSVVLSRLCEDMPFVPPDRRRARRVLLTADLSLLGIAVIASMAFSGGGVRHLRLNEVCDAKVGRVSDGGYIEIFNDGGFPCRTGGLYLSNDGEHLRKYALPDLTAPAGELLLIPLESAVFSLSRSGGSEVILSDGSGRIIDRVVADKPREGSYAYCRIEENGSWRYMLPTPGERNAASAAILPKPVFSAEAGFYQEPFDLSLTAGKGTVIHYTTDGTVPTKDSPVYTKPIRVRDRSSEPNRRRSLQRVVFDWKNYSPDATPVKKSFIVRAVAADPQGAVSEEAVASYFIGGRFDADRAVISLAADDEALFGEDGMYVTGRTYDAWYLGGGKGGRPKANFEIKGTETPVSIEYFADGRRLTFSQKGGLRLQGDSTRWLAMKRFSVFSRREYSGRSTFPTEIFKGKATHSVVLREGFENAVSMYTVPDRDVAVVKCVPVTVYLNGEFWYDTYMQEKYNDTFFRQTYGVDGVEFYKTGITDEMIQFLQSHDLSEQASYEQFDRLIDIQSYIDYLCANVYLGNTDYNEYANTAIWRTVRKENDAWGDGRWRWAFYDMDLQTAGCRKNYGLNDITDAQLDTYNIVCDWDPPVNQRQLYCALKANEGFRRQFVLTMTDMINNNFSEEKMTALLASFGEDISWHDYFFRERPANMLAFTAKEFGLPDRTGELTVTTDSPQAGSVRVNTSVIDLSEGSWTGRYFTAYPVTVTAVPAPGYRFREWSDGGSDPTVEISIKEKGGVTLHAVFEKE